VYCPDVPKGNTIFDTSRFYIRKTKKMIEFCRNGIENQILYLDQVVLILINGYDRIICWNEDFFIIKFKISGSLKVCNHAFLAILDLIP
jgi:hypothetical protein